MMKETIELVTWKGVVKKYGYKEGENKGKETTGPGKKETSVRGYREIDRYIHSITLHTEIDRYI